MMKKNKQERSENKKNNTYLESTLKYLEETASLKLLLVNIIWEVI